MQSIIGEFNEGFKDGWEIVSRKDTYINKKIDL